MTAKEEMLKLVEISTEEQNLEYLKILNGLLDKRSEFCDCEVPLPVQVAKIPEFCIKCTKDIKQNSSEAELH